MVRRLAAVMMADVAGYGRLSQDDEEGTRARFQADLRDVFEAQIAGHDGRLVKTMGDGLLVEFHSVVDAMRCAMEVQRAEAERNAGLPADRRMEFRIGINLGDVIVEGDDIHGDGVNIADRLQNLADAGGVAISGTAYDQVKGKLAVGYADLGPQRVKNIAEPVRVYRVLMDPAAAGRTIGEARTSGRSRRWPAAAIIAIAVAVAAGAAAWWRPWEPRIESASLERMALPLPEKPSIAVLPFSNMSDDPKQEYFADGMTDDLITELSKVSGLFVIARNSTFAYKGRPVPPKQVSEELGVRYVLEGSVQRAGDQLRINAQLIDALSGGHEWADRYDGSFADVFSFQDKVATSIADSLAIRLTNREQRLIAEQETSVPAAYDAFLRGWEHYRRSTPDDYAKAIPYFEEAIRLDPEYGRAYAALALVFFQSQDFYWSASLGLSRAEAYEKAEDYLGKAQQKRPTSTTHYVAASMARGAHAYATGIAGFKEAIVFDPGDSWSYAQLALTLNFAGRSAEALPFIKTAMRLDPHYPPQFLYFLGATQFMMNRPAEAAATLERATRLNPDHEWSILFLAATYGYLGRKESAASAIARYNDLKVRLGGIPLWVAELRRRTSISDFNARLFEGLRLAGAPESFDDSEFARQNSLTADEVRALFFGHRLRGRTPFSAHDLGASFTADGLVTFSGDWGPGDGGVVRFDGADFCFKWGFRAVERCAALFRNPGGTMAKENEYIWYDEFGAFPFSRVE
jgi:TolB-like protein/class 3 adenylate cyclase/Flp pilus assembly protein TadD